jgi:hypothetical protein
MLHKDVVLLMHIIHLQLVWLCDISNDMPRFQALDFANHIINVFVPDTKEQVFAGVV